MFGGALNRDAFISMMCQQSRAGRGVTAQWTMQILGVKKTKALEVLAKLASEGVLSKTEITWRSNAKKFYFYPSDAIWTRYHAKEFRDGYLQYMAAMMRA